MNQLRDSKTRINLMKAFAGESQARNRYTFGASQAKGEKLALIEQAFLYTADQERAESTENCCAKNIAMAIVKIASQQLGEGSAEKSPRQNPGYSFNDT